MTVYMESGGTAPIILISVLDGGEVSGQPHTPATLPQGKNPRYPVSKNWMGPIVVLKVVDMRRISWLCPN
jgi:hypothetical protein